MQPWPIVALPLARVACTATIFFCIVGAWLVRLHLQAASGEAICELCSDVLACRRHGDH